jgi:GDP/UDP-N,N'-diacetylbacillosamine 2-epimerase (hydrolysing)
MQGIRDDPELDLQLVATGMHLSSAFGSTYLDMERDGFQITAKVPVLTDLDTPAGVAQSMGLGLAGFAQAFADLKPDVIVVLGDRYEIFSAVAAALVARIPVAHLHGGELTEGAFDDALRHAITKMSHLHFVAAQPYRQRVIQLGEAPETVFLVGGLGVDSLLRVPLLSRSELEQVLDFSFGKRTVLVTFHPATLSAASPGEQMAELLVALDAMPDTHFIFTLPNADNGGQEIAAQIDNFVARNPRAKSYAALGQQRYFSCLAHCDMVVGNSSSGLTEAPSFKKPTVNIGDRQRGRLKASSVIDCEPTSASISAALDRACSEDFIQSLGTAINPYGQGGAADKVVATLKAHPLGSLIPKVFFDWSMP